MNITMTFTQNKTNFLKQLIFTLAFILIMAGGQASAQGMAEAHAIGDKDAPVEFMNFSSLSCPHCATFHVEVLPQIKKEYIDTGKARMVFVPMPLNSAALDGELIARCVPEDEYQDALDYLYENQARWALTGNHQDALLTQAQMLGLSREQASECLDDTAMEEAVVNLARNHATRHVITSTPTFIFEGNRVLKGVGNFDRYAEMIDYLYDQKTSKPTIEEIRSGTKMDTEDETNEEN